MKATEVHKIARSKLSQWCKENGFKRMKSGMASWFKPIGKNFLVFWFQCSRDGWDRFVGSKFVVEFQISKVAEIGQANARRWRFPHFLNQNDRKVVTQMQNRVITKLENQVKTTLFFKWIKEQLIGI